MHCRQYKINPTIEESHQLAASSNDALNREASALIIKQQHRTSEQSGQKDSVKTDTKDNGILDYYTIRRGLQLALSGAACFINPYVGVGVYNLVGLIP